MTPEDTRPAAGPGDAGANPSDDPLPPLPDPAVPAEAPSSAAPDATTASSSEATADATTGAATDAPADASAVITAETTAATPDVVDDAEAPPVPPLPAYLHRSDTGWSVFKRIVRAKTRNALERASRQITDRTLRIGISARIFHPQADGKGLQSKTLQYLEESIAHWVMARNVLVFMVPTVNQQGRLHPSEIRMRDYATILDGLVLQGGADVSPMSYSMQATRPEWHGDRVRDVYELELLQAFIDTGKPVLGICRGCQLINVAFGGTLHQDIASELPAAISHVNDSYDANWHEIVFPEDSSLLPLFKGRQGGTVNSIHHQSVNRLGRDLSIEALSADDQVVEAIRLRQAPFVVGLQWHPEFHSADSTGRLLDCTPILDQFLRAARETRF